ncbi:MAG: transketolase, partial [Albidovulum sp.]|nr:transketolase [Albidovulum sp.]
MPIAELKSKHPDHWNLASAIRVLSMDAVQSANSGHPGMPMGMADVATVLFRNHLKFDSQAPKWPDRDRFILSAGHGSMLLYSLLHLTGYSDMPLSEIKNFRQFGSRTAGHPEFGHAAGIETTTGPLAQGLGNAVGFAIAEESLRKRFGSRIVDHFTYVIAGDGCLMEGLSQEAIGLAGKLQLSKLILLWDDNRISIDGSVSLSDKTEQAARFSASGWAVFECNGHDPESIDRSLTEARRSDLPALVACKTRIGFGSPSKEGTAAAHGSPLGNDEIERVRDAYGWYDPPFAIPSDIRMAWQRIGAQGSEARKQWQRRLEELPRRKRELFERTMSGEAPSRLPTVIRKLKKEISQQRPNFATRKSSEKVLTIVNRVLPETIGGSADLTGSNNTKTPDLGIFSAENRGGRYIYFGIREHAMAAAMNGMALHGGIRPYGGTFLCFADYARPSMRLSALMGVPVVYVMTHDSIGLGEDGPTHQPIEHLSMLRATPGLEVFRPCDTVETAEAWELALTSKNTPSVLALTRQGLPTLRTVHKYRNLVSLGAYVIAPESARRQVVLLATGSEVSVAMDARSILESENIGTRVVSMPCIVRFERQEEGYMSRVLPA